MSKIKEKREFRVSRIPIDANSDHLKEYYEFAKEILDTTIGSLSINLRTGKPAELVNLNGTESKNPSTTYQLAQRPFNFQKWAKLSNDSSTLLKSIRTKSQDILGFGWSLKTLAERAEDVEKISSLDIESITRTTLTQRLKGKRTLGKAVRFFTDKVVDYSVSIEQDGKPVNVSVKATLNQMFEKLVIDYIQFGNAYMCIHRDDNGSIISIQHLPATIVYPFTDNVRYFIDGAKGKIAKKFGVPFSVNSQTAKLSPINSGKGVAGYEIIHIRNYFSGDQCYGLPDSISVVTSIILDAYAKRYNLNRFRNAGIPKYAVIAYNTSFDGYEKQKQIIKDYFSQSAVESGGGTMFLEFGSNDFMDEEKPQVEFKEIQDGVDPSPYIDLMEKASKDIIASQAVPPHRMGRSAGEKLSSNAIDALNRVYAVQEVNPLKSMFAKALTNFIRHEYGLNTKDIAIELNQMVEFEDQIKVERALKLFNEGLMTGNEARTELGLDEISNPEMKAFLDNLFYKGAVLGYANTGMGPENNNPGVNNGQIKPKSEEETEEEENEGDA